MTKRVITSAKRPSKEIGLGPLLFNIYTYDLPSMTFQKYANADELAMLHASRYCKAVENTLSQDMTTLSAYLQTWRLKLSSKETVTAVFHLNNREAKCKLNVCLQKWQTITTLSSPNVSWGKAGQIAHFHLSSRGFAQNFSTRIALLRHLRDPDGCRCQDIAHFCSFLRLLHTWVLCTSLVS